MLRRATAYRSLKNYKDATADLQKVLQQDPGNATAVADLKAIQEELANSAKASAPAAGQQGGGGKGTRVPVQETKDTSSSGKGPGASRDAPRPSASSDPSLPPLPPRVQKLKEEGSVFFKAGQYVDAEVKYTAALNELEKGECRSGGVR